MVRWLLMELEDYNCWTIAEAAGHRGPHRLQHVLSRAVWDEQQVLDIASAWAAGYLDDGDAVLIVDETADEKSSADAAGAARQYSGTIGGVALCQVAVTLTYATSCGHTLIGRALYLPEGCAADEEHRELAGVPEGVMFATKPQLAGGLLGRAQSLGIRAAFVAGDEVYGGRATPARGRLRPGRRADPDHRPRIAAAPARHRHPAAPARPRPPAALVGLAAPPPAPRPPSPPALAQLRRDNTMITPSYSRRNCAS